MSYEIDPEVQLREWEAREEREVTTAIETLAPAACPDCPWCAPAINTGTGILALFASAPTMKGLWLPGNIKITRAGARSSNPGGLWIAEQGEDGRYFGSIRADGTMRMTRNWGPWAIEEGYSEMLKRLAAFGAEELARLGKGYGRCCYCGRLLTDPISVALGYGPVCAGYHGLPHNEAAAQAAGMAVAA